MSMTFPIAGRMFRTNPESSVLVVGVVDFYHLENCSRPRFVHEAFRVREKNPRTDVTDVTDFRSTPPVLNEKPKRTPCLYALRLETS